MNLKQQITLAHHHRVGWLILVLVQYLLGASQPVVSLGIGGKCYTPKPYQFGHVLWLYDCIFFHQILSTFLLTPSNFSPILSKPLLKMLKDGGNVKSILGSLEEGAYQSLGCPKCPCYYPWSKMHTPWPYLIWLKSWTRRLGLCSVHQDLCGSCTACLGQFQGD